MAIFPIDISRGEDGFERLSFAPPPGADFQPIVNMHVPTLMGDVRLNDRRQQGIPHEGVVGIIEFERKVDAVVRLHCEIIECDSSVKLSSRKKPGDTFDSLQSCEVECYAENCPLSRPPEAGDREPLNPEPSPPSLSAEALLENISI